MFFKEFNINDSSYKEIKNKIKERKNSYAALGYFIDGTFRVIERHPFNEECIEILLKEGWNCNPDYYMNHCETYTKIINLDKKLISQGKIYDFYDRDIILMHELNHCWYYRFNVLSQKCLADNPVTIHEFENRLINEFISRKNRANPQVSKEQLKVLV